MGTIPTPSPDNVTPSATPPASRQPAPARRRTRRWTLALLTGAAALMFAALVVVRYAAAPDEDVAANDQTDRLEEAPVAAPYQTAAVAPEVEPAPATAARAEAPAAHAATAAPVVTRAPKKAPTVRPAKSRVAASARSTAPTPAPAIAKVAVRADAAAIAGQAPPVSIENVGPAPVTLTGCLEVSVDRDEFRLSDTDGIDAPKSRSWRTGFLKKRPTPVALVEAPDPRGLQIQVGKRVAATGRLVDRELIVSSVRVVSPSCD
jgi:hypothetical protein